MSITSVYLGDCKEIIQKHNNGRFKQKYFDTSFLEFGKECSKELVDRTLLFKQENMLKCINGQTTPVIRYIEEDDEYAVTVMFNGCVFSGSVYDTDSVNVSKHCDYELDIKLFESTKKIIEEHPKLSDKIIVGSLREDFSSLFQRNYEYYNPSNKVYIYAYYNNKESLERKLTELEDNDIFRFHLEVQKESRGLYTSSCTKILFNDNLYVCSTSVLDEINDIYSVNDNKLYKLSLLSTYPKEIQEELLKVETKARLFSI